jgi:6-pyruvoyltetrahydropterin/6-carboxytetrahydropterin synthase
MKATICRKIRFNAAHRLHVPDWDAQTNFKVFGKCNNPNYHGHNYVLEVKVRGEIDPVSGYVMDMKILKALLENEVEDKFDHKNLNLDTSEFKDLNPTAENIAAVIYNNLRLKIENTKELTLILHETENNSVEYNGK